VRTSRVRDIREQTASSVAETAFIRKAS
jgi:hypothetical protein